MPVAVDLLRQRVVYPFRRHYAHWARAGELPLLWYGERNWGDALSPVLAGLLSGRPVHQPRASYYDHFIAIGSILRWANSRSEVWGSGFVKEGQTVQVAPKKIHAVRGPLTRAALLKAGIDCPEVYGDPALLLPGFFDPEVTKQYDVGIIPHYADKDHPWIARHRHESAVRIIDVQGDLWDFVRAVKSCDMILSSALHGLICADAYGVPNAWIQLSDLVIGRGFKFRDYRLSIGGDEPTPVEIDEGTPIAAAAVHARVHPLKIDLVKLLWTCPFLNTRIRAALRATAFLGGDGARAPRARQSPVAHRGGRLDSGMHFDHDDGAP